MTVALAALPVVLFLSALLLMDTFTLVPVRHVARALVAGIVAALVTEAILRGLAPVDEARGAALVAAPLIVESAKGLIVAWLVATRRVGFLVDAAAVGFAIGAGFAFVVNVLDLRAAHDASLPVPLVEELATTMLHGATTAIAAMIGRMMVDRHPRHTLAALVPGVILAIVIHALLVFPPLPAPTMAAVRLSALPLLLVAVFVWSERATRAWVVGGLDLDIELLQLVTSDQFADTRFAAYLRGLRQRFPGPVVADMFCLLRLELEFSVQARALVLARHAGLEVPVDEDLAIALGEYQHLRRSIGRTGLLALGPMHIVSNHGEGHRHLLARARASTVAR